MRLTIDNLDGRGALDYSDCVAGDGPLRVVRTLNAPSVCHCMVDLSGTSLPRPVRRGRVVVTTEASAVLFTGYLGTEPSLVLAGEGIGGPVYRMLLSAVSDEWLLDRLGATGNGVAMGETGGAAMAVLTGRAGGNLVATSGLTGGRQVGLFQPEPTKVWSVNAGLLAGAVYSAYRVMGGAVNLQPAGAVSHTLSDGVAGLKASPLEMGAKRGVANDVTISGEMEPQAYVTEVFAGDGTTNVFRTSQHPFGHLPAASGTLLSDSFNGGSFDTRTWVVSDPGSLMRLTSAGLTVSGGNGLDGQTVLESIDALEIGGSLLLEMGSVQMGPGSDGVVCGLYSGPVSRASCFAGYNVRQSNGATVVCALVNGVESGTPMTLLSGHRYTLRVRVHSVEPMRVKQVYYTMVNGVVQSFGGGLVDAPADVVFDAQDLGSSSDTPATVLYQGTVSAAPATCGFAAVNSLHLSGTAGYCRVTQTGSGWVTSVDATGARRVRLTGAAGEGVDCTMSSSGVVTFLAGRVPAAGELVEISYRTSGRAVARMEDPAAVAREAAAGVPGAARWMGHVVRPVARSSADCESAAAALLSVSTQTASALAGKFEVESAEEMWPGDLVTVARMGETVSAVLRSVELTDEMAVPETIRYSGTFANDWAEGVGMHISEAVATDVPLPAAPQDGPGKSLAGLQTLTLTSVTSTALQVDAGLEAPVGGGFEVRRRDGAFGAGVDQDLVLRSAVRSFTLPREAQVERYYVRMYDGSTPPLYSRVSSAVFIDVPVG